jgi:DNA-binding transcriptional MocR family regulator
VLAAAADRQVQFYDLRRCRLDPGRGSGQDPVEGFVLGYGNAEESEIDGALADLSHALRAAEARRIGLP